jgi:hypothetical protein
MPDRWQFLSQNAYDKKEDRERLKKNFGHKKHLVVKHV